MRHHFHAEQWVPYPRDRVFAFFANPANLPPLMPRWQHARIEKAELVSPPPLAVPSSAHVAAGEGSVLIISFRPAPLVPLRLEWVAYIAEFRWNEFFCDEQRKGPFRYFRHCHRVQEETRDGIVGSLVRDEVEYELPLGWLGDVANGVAMKRQIRKLFSYRHKMLALLLPRGEAK